MEIARQTWLALELYDPFVSNAFDKASDIYALGYLLQQLYEFWQKGQELWSVHMQYATQMEEIHIKNRQWMLVAREERKSIFHILEFFRSLKIELVHLEMLPSIFMP